jgi:hypothetical protein
LILRKQIAKIQPQFGDKRMNKQVTVLSLKDEIIKSYGHVYFEWSKQLDIELEVAAWLPPFLIMIPKKCTGVNHRKATKVVKFK